MKLAFITYEFPPDTGKGGIGTYTSQVAAMLAAHGVSVYIFCGSTHRSGREVLDGYTIHRVRSVDGTDFKEKVVEQFAAVHQQAAFDIIESPEINSPAYYIKKKFPQLPLLVRLHAPDHLVESIKKSYYSFFIKLRFSMGALIRGRLDAGYWRPYNFAKDKDYIFCTMADQLVAPSEAMQNWVSKNWLIPKEKVGIVPNPYIPSEALLNLPIQQMAMHKEIVFFGRLNVLKGLVNATLALKKILTAFPEYHFKIVGDNGPGPQPGINMQQWMQQQLKPVAASVEFISGYNYQQLPALIANAEIVVLPSLFESFSYTCAEAMAAGKAVVGSEGTGMEFITNMVNGILINPEQPGEIYTAVKKLILDDALRYRISKNAREDITQLFSETMLAHRYIDLYKKTIEENTYISFS